MDQNQHHCLVEKGDLQRLREETLTENQPAQRLRWQPHHWDRVLWANNRHTLNIIIKETDSGIRIATIMNFMGKDFSKYQLNAQFFYSSTIYMLHYVPQHVSSSTLLIIRRTNCITTASGIVTLCKQPYSMRVESGERTAVRSPPAYCTAAYRGLRYQRLWWYNWSSWWWAACCSKHVEERSVTYILLKNKRIVHYVGILKSLCYDAWSEKHPKIHGQSTTWELKVTWTVWELQNHPHPTTTHVCEHNHVHACRFHTLTSFP